MTATVPAPGVVSLWVPGEPAPQGSKKAVPNQRTGRVALVESSAGVKPWREDIRWHLLGLPPQQRQAWPIHGAVSVELEFVLKRPKATPKKRTPQAVKKPDLDKLDRAVCDAIGSAGVWGDDAQVVQLASRKRLAELDETTGCHITIVPLGVA